MNATRSLTATICARLSHGPASAISLARWCNLSTPFMTRMLDGLVRAGVIEKVGKRYAHPLSPARRIEVGRGSRWELRA